MKKTTLAVPAGSARVDAFLSEARVSGRALAGLSLEASEGAGDSASPGSESSAAVIPWNPLSFASARAAIIEAETALGGFLGEFVIFADPPEDMTAMAELTPKGIERAALEWAAGYAELIREAVLRFDQRDGGVVVLVVAQVERGPLGAMAAGALLGLAEGILASGFGRSRFLALRDESGQPDLLARHVIKMLDESSRDQGKIQRFGGRSGLFGLG